MSGGSMKKHNNGEIRQKIIEDVQKAFCNKKDLSIKDLIKLSGHRMPTVIKYFGSVEALLHRSKIQLKTVAREEIIDDIFKIHRITKKPINKKSLKEYGKFYTSVYIKNIGNIQYINNKILGQDLKTKIPREEILECLKKVCSDLGRAPTNQDLHISGKFSQNVFRREFGGLQNALREIGMFEECVPKNKAMCPVCLIEKRNIIQHMGKSHKEELKKQNDLVLNLFSNGESAASIASREDIIYSGATSILRLVKKHFSKSDLESIRKKKISDTLNKKYKNGQLDWVTDININKNISDETCNKISNTMKEQYKRGERISWNLGANKNSSKSIKLGSKKTSNSIIKMYKTGQISKKIGEKSSRWVKDRDAISARNRTGAGFSKSDREKIKYRAHYKCESCGISQELLLENDGVLQCDHILPIKYGGLDDWEGNGQALCPQCHAKKTFGIPQTNSSNIQNLDSIIVYDNTPLRKKYIEALSRAEKIKLAHHLFGVFSSYDFSNAKYSKVAFDRDLNSIIKTNLQLNDKKIINSNNSGLRVCRNFFYNINKISSRGRRTIDEAISDPEILFNIICNRLGLNPNHPECFNIYPSTILFGAKNSFMASRGSIFKPSVAKAIYEYWVKDGDRVYDYSAGFGGRMLGLHTGNINATYIGTDPNTETYQGLLDMAKYLNCDAEIHNKCSEDFVPVSINFAFSSPPYFNYERYCNEPTQSYNKYSNYNDWLEKYWRITVQNIKLSLVSNGVFAVNTGNFSNGQMDKLHSDMIKIISDEGFALTDRWDMVTKKSHTAKDQSPKFEPICFYKLK